MHDISHPASADPSTLLASALRAEVARVDPEPRLDDVLDAAHDRLTWLRALLATLAVLGALLIVAGLLLMAFERQPEPPSPSPTTRLMEA